MSFVDSQALPLPLSGGELLQPHCLLPAACSFFISTPFPKGPPPNNSSPLCHFRPPSLKLALGESFLVLTVEQILFNITFEEFPPSAGSPSPLLPLPLLTWYQGFLLCTYSLCCVATACYLHWDNVLVAPPQWYHEVDLRKS